MHRLSSLLLSALAMAGCASSPTPNYDTRFGDAVRLGRQNQTLNPQPSTTAFIGLDGKAAREAVGRYHDTYKAPPPVVNVINIGGPSSNSGN